MKTLSTQTLDNIPADLDTIGTLLGEMIDDDFVILDDTDTSNYIQTTPDDTGLLVEVRYYDSVDDDIFCHYRKMGVDSSEVLTYFKTFYQDTVIDISDWQDITAKFNNHIYIKGKKDNQTFDYYIFNDEWNFDDFFKELKEMTTSDVFVIYPYGEYSEQMLEIQIDNNDYHVTYITYQDIKEIRITKSINSTDELQAVIVKLLNDDMGDWI